MLKRFSSKIFKPKLSSDVIQELTQLNVSYLNADESIEIHMLIGLNHYWDIIQPDFIRFHLGLSSRILFQGLVLTTTASRIC